MPVLLKIKTYKWLQQIGVFRNDPIASRIDQCCEVPYDEEIYLQNGYLIGVTLRKNVKAYSQSYQELLKVRKIATLKSSQNWQIIEPYLRNIGIDSLTPYNQLNAQIEISTAIIAQILEQLYEKYSPKEQQRLALARKLKCNYVDFYNFDPDKPLEDANNSLQFFCILLVKNLQISLGEAFGLLIDKSKYMKKLVVQGSKKDEYQSLKKLYERTAQVWPMLQQFINASPKDLDKVIQGLAEGVLSQSMDIIHSTLNLLSYVNNQQWFIKYGYYKLLSSSYIQCFYFTIQRLSPRYESILNQKLHSQISDKTQLFTILNNLVKILPKTIYCKQILSNLPISYFYQQCYSILNLDDIDDQPPKLILSAKDLLARLMMYFPDKIPNSYVPRILQTFKYQPNRSYGDTYHTVSLLFDVLQVMMHKQSPLTQKLFKTCMKYVGSTFGQTRHWIIENLKNLYQRMTRSFPLGCMLAMYSLDPVAQADEYQLFDLIAQDNSHMTTQQATLALSYLTKYVQTQIHCKCFTNIINKFLHHHGKVAAKWGEQSCTHMLAKMLQISIPMLNHGQINILNPKPPVKNRVINSIGMKRKQMLKFRQYQLGKQMLQLLLNVNDKGFLNFYVDSLTHTITTIQKQIGHNKKQLVLLLKKLRLTAKKRGQQILQSTPMADMVKSIIENRSAMHRTFKTELQHDASHSLSVIQSDKWMQSESRLMPEPEPKSNAIEQQQDEQEDDQNQFITGSFIHKPQPSQQQSLNNSSELLPQMMLLPFTSDQRLDEHIRFYANDILEHNQIAYINTLKQKYSNIVAYCVNLLKQLFQASSDIDYVLREFMRDLGLTRIIDISQVQEIYLKCKIIANSQYQLIQNLLIQIAFRTFDFKKDRRVSVLCLSSLFVLIQQNIKEKLNNIKIKKQNNIQITKNVQFQFKLCNTVHKSNHKSQSYFICFSVLNDILSKGLNFNLMEPLSKLINQFTSPSSQQHGRKSFYQNSQIPLINEKSELDILEEELQAQSMMESELIQVEKNEERQQSKYRMRKPKKRSITQQSRQSSQIISPKLVDNKQLRNKLSLRIKMLQGQVRKKQKATKKLFTEPAEPSQLDNIQE